MSLTRRAILAGGAVAATASVLPGVGGALPSPLTRRIPTSGEAVPAVGLGTWITFNVGNDPALLAARTGVMAAFFDAGGRAIDSSPMYGSSQATVGFGLQELGRPADLFSMDKVWTRSADRGPRQIEKSRQNWQIPAFALMQVHNLLAWRSHLPMLREMKAAGHIRYIGITTSDGRRHGLFEEIMRTEPLDFIQVTYNVVDREVEERILPLAQDRGIGVIINRPFKEGALTRWLADKPLPDWAEEIGASSWAQLILKFILSHPAVTMAIPATTRADHAVENIKASTGLLPDSAMRAQISDHIRTL